MNRRLGFTWAALAAVLALAAGTASLGADEPSSVRMWREAVEIPTYPLGEPDKNPIFYSGRKYQGAKGPVYPYAMLDRLSDTRQAKRYDAVYLENKYVHLMILPELGGRIFTGLDKTNGYDFFYRQHVIKPALVGMAGAWMSGGVEWNIPHHHRVTTSMPVDYRLVENADGSKTVWLGETEWRHRMKWLVGLTLYPDNSCLEVTTKLFNRTPLAHTMLCFANVAVHANADYQVIFPPGTEFGTQHAKREFVHWPVGREVYNRLDRSGVDLSWWKNQPSPVSIFAWNYEDDFVGGYDHGKRAGVVHVADHHLAPGKKFFTWGCGEEGRMWDRVLTDGDGPYIELMTGAYSDNQPDYSWVQPYETRIVREYWYPLRALGGIKNANREAAVNLELDAASHGARIAVNTTSDLERAKVVLQAAGKVVFDKTVAIGPARPFAAQVTLDAQVKAEQLRLSVWSNDRELIHYQPAKPRGQAMPKPVTPPPAPRDVKTVDELYEIGLRLEQFHNPALEPYPYYEEALRRDPGDPRANTALGILYCKRGMYIEAEKHLRAAIARITHHYTSPKDTEALYYLGVALRAQGNRDAADEAFHRATWGYAWVAPSYMALAQSACREGRYAEALEFLERSLTTNALNVKGLAMKALLLRKLGRTAEASAAASDAGELDPLDFWSTNESALTAATAGDSVRAAKVREELETRMRGAVQSYLEIAADYASCGAWDEAIGVLIRFVHTPGRSRVDPMVYYDWAYYIVQKGNAGEAILYRELAAAQPRDYCFPFRLESIDVLEHAIAADPRDARALYYLGNLLYDLQPRRAIDAWERSRDLDPKFATVHRNLGLAYARALHDHAKAVASLTMAVTIDPSESRPFCELDEVSEAACVSHKKRLAILEQHAATVGQRDDALLRHVGLHVWAGNYDRALAMLGAHHFRRWEGEHGPHAMYVEALLLRGQQHLDAKRFADARKDFSAALEYPDNFETGRPLRGIAKTAQIHYLLGVANEALGQSAEAKRQFQQAAIANRDSLPILYYHALAQTKLGDKAAAQKMLDELIRAGTEALAALKHGPRVDFFGIFGTPQAVNVQAAEAHYLIGLGRLGHGRRDQAQSEFQQAITLNPNHLGAKTQLSGPGKGVGPR